MTSFEKIILFTCIKRITRVTLNKCKMLALSSSLLYPSGKKKHYPLYKTAKRPDIFIKCKVQRNITFCCQNCDFVLTVPISC